MRLPHSILKALADRQETGALRQLRPELVGIDFYSNDYLSFARDPKLAEAIRLGSETLQQPLHGATGARLLSGGTAFAIELEKSLADYFEGEAALLFNSGYAANLGLMQALLTRHDVVLYDELCHTSIREGIRLGYAKAFGFRHNDLAHLEMLCSKHKTTVDQTGGTIYIVSESLFSMDGDLCPLEGLVNLANRFRASLLLDEAHSTGLMGNDKAFGAGLTVQTGLTNGVLARVHTFGKAMGCHGACIVGPQSLIDYLINFSRAFIYTTMMPLHSLVSIRQAFLHPEIGDRQQTLHNVIGYWKAEAGKVGLPTTDGPIQTISARGNNHCKQMALNLQQAGFAVKPVLAPTVPVGAERIRVCLHAHNTEHEIAAFFNALAAFHQTS